MEKRDLTALHRFFTRGLERCRTTEVTADRAPVY
jgi:hypothetical protein